MANKNRLPSILSDFAKRFELPHKMDKDGLGAELGIPYDDKTINASYSFDESGDGYEFVAGIGKIDLDKKDQFASRVMQSEPVRGITERITQDGKYVALGSRTGLKNQAAGEIQRGLSDDVFRVTSVYDKFKSEENDE